MAGDSPWGASSPFRALRVLLSVACTVAVRATQAAGVLAKPCPWISTCHQAHVFLVSSWTLFVRHVCAHARTHTPLSPVQPLRHAVTRRWPVPWTPGFRPVGHPRFLPHGTQTRPCHFLASHPSDSVSAARSATIKLSIQIPAHVGCGINYEREISSLCGQYHGVGRDRPGQRRPYEEALRAASKAATSSPCLWARHAQHAALAC